MLRYVMLCFVMFSYVPFRSASFRYVTLSCVSLHCVTLCWAVLRCVMLHYVALRCVKFRYIVLRYARLCYVTLRYVTSVSLRYVTISYVSLRYITLRFVSLRYIYITLRYVLFRYIYISITLRFVLALPTWSCKTGSCIIEGGNNSHLFSPSTLDLCFTACHIATLPIFVPPARIPGNEKRSQWDVLILLRRSYVYWISGPKKVSYYTTFSFSVSNTGDAFSIIVTAGIQW